jgi:hypothetical protein
MVKNDLISKYLQYRPDMDFNGEQGMELANQLIERYGSIENAMKVINKEGKKGKEDRIVKLAKKENDLEKALIFIKRANGMSVNPDNLYSEREAKEQLIREYKGEKKYLYGFSDYKLGVAFKSVYYSALKKTKK